MSAATDLALTSPRDGESFKTGPIPVSFKLENLHDPAVITEILYRSQTLTDDAYQDLVDDIGHRAARLILRAKAVQGDVKAIELYDKIVHRDRKARAERSKPAARTVSGGEFIQSPRATDENAPE
jgi:hypothetical protein